MREKLYQSSKTLAPLLGVFSFVALSTVAISYFRDEYAVMQVGHTFMAMFFLTFGGFKVYNLSGFKEAFKMYDPVAKKNDFYATIYPFLEIGLGVAYITILLGYLPGIELGVYLTTILLMGFNALGVLEAILNGRDLKCACLGNVFNVPMTTVTLVEDLGMVVMALWMLSGVL